MFPILFSIGPFKLYSVLIFLFIAFFAGLFVIYKRGIELRFDEEELFNAVFWILFCLLVGSRFIYVVTHLAAIGLNPIDWINIITKPGFSTSGALLGLIVGLVTSARKRKWDVYMLGDVVVTGLSLSQVFIFAGSLFNGNGFGTPTTMPWGVTLPGALIKRHPIQLLEMIAYTTLFIFLYRIEQKYRTLAWYKGKRSQAQSGFVMACYFIAVGIIGLLLDMWRDPEHLAFLRFDVLTHFGLLLFGIWVMMHRSGTLFKSKKNSSSRHFFNRSKSL